MPINIKNYRTIVPADQSINSIEKLLVAFGAHNIMKEYDHGKTKAISFRIVIDNFPFAFQLPGKPTEVFNWLDKNSGGSEKIKREQAERITWKQLHEWLHLQLSMIEINQLEIIQALLPYSYDVATNETFYQRLKGSKFKLLTTGGGG